MRTSHVPRSASARSTSTAARAATAAATSTAWPTASRDLDFVALNEVHGRTAFGALRSGRATRPAAGHAMALRPGQSAVVLSGVRQRAADARAGDVLAADPPAAAVRPQLPEHGAGGPGMPHRSKNDAVHDPRAADPRQSPLRRRAAGTTAGGDRAVSFPGRAGGPAGRSQQRRRRSANPAASRARPASSDAVGEKLGAKDAGADRLDHRARAALRGRGHPRRRRLRPPAGLGGIGVTTTSGKTL